MKKKLIIINGTMGVGKTEVSKVLYKKLSNAVWLDGDWCWMMHPFNVTAENIEMVEDNINHLLRNFLKNPNFDHIIFNWVMHREEIICKILSGLQDLDFELHKFSIVCSPKKLRERFENDPNRAGLDPSEAVARLSLYDSLDTEKINTDDKTPEAAASEIAGRL